MTRSLLLNEIGREGRKIIIIDLPKTYERELWLTIKVLETEWIWVIS